MKGMWKGKPRVKRVEEKTLSPRISQGYCFKKSATLGEGDSPNEKSHG